MYFVTNNSSLYSPSFPLPPLCLSFSSPSLLLSKKISDDREGKKLSALGKILAYPKPRLTQRCSCS